MTTDVHETLRDSAPMPIHELDMRTVRRRADRLRSVRRVWIGLCALGVACAISFGAVFLAGTGSDDHGEPHVIAPATNTIAFDPSGDTVNLPAGWFQVTEPLTPLVDPREILTIATFAVSTGEHTSVCVGDAPPSKALAAMGADDALVWIVEWIPGQPRGAETNTLRPAQFAPDQFAARNCVAQSNPRLIGSELLFTERGRIFDVYVVTGTDLPPNREHEIYETLDSLRFSSP